MQADDAHSIQASYAPSNRAACRGCQQKIPKESIRMTQFVNGEGFKKELHYHLECFQLQKKSMMITYKDVLNIDDLKKEDQAKVSQKIEYLKVEGLKKKKRITKSKTIQSQPDEDIGSSQIVSEDKQRLIKKPAKNVKKKKKLNITEDEEYDPDQGEEVLKSESESDNEPFKQYRGYTDKQIKQLQEVILSLQTRSVAQLKGMLKENQQKCSGTKQELIERVADCKVLGNIPKCPDCQGGRPKFIPELGIYKCPGFMDDTDFRHCNKLFQFDEIQRIEWQE